MGQWPVSMAGGCTLGWWLEDGSHRPSWPISTLGLAAGHLSGLAAWCLGTMLLLLPWWCWRLLLFLLACLRPLRAVEVPGMVFPPVVGALCGGCLLGLVAANAFLCGMGQAAHPAPDRMLTAPLEVVEVLTLIVSYKYSLVGT